MFNWVVKVVPQPPEVPETPEPVKAPAKVPPKTREVKSPPQKNTNDSLEDSQSQTGVLGWLSNGFVSALPQPAGSPQASNNRSGEDGERPGVINWVAQGLTKVLPQPQEKYKETEEEEEHTEVYEVATMPDYDPLPHIPVVEMVSEDEEEENPSHQFPPNVVNWVRNMVPQPVIRPSGAVIVDSSKPPRSTRSSLEKVLSPPPESLSGISLDTDSKVSGVVGWFVSGLGLKLPQPVVPPKGDDGGAVEVLQKGGKSLRAP